MNLDLVVVDYLSHIPSRGLKHKEVVLSNAVAFGQISIYS